MNILDYVMLNFSQKELTIYRMRNLEHKTLDEVGKEFGVSRQRIRDIVEKIRTKAGIFHLDVNISLLN